LPVTIPVDTSKPPPGAAAEPPRLPVPVGPSAEEWRAMTPDARERFLVQVNDALTEPPDTMTEGRQHKKAKARIVELLDLHFKAMGRVVYVAEEMSVVYPGERAFSPDVLAVLEVPQPEDDPRLSWVVVDEGKGIDLAFEVLHHGDRNKDLVRNVAWYARLGIPEYFVYDRGQQRIHGYRLAEGGGRYDRIVPQAGRFASRVLGLDLAIQDGKLRFFQGMAELFDTENLIGRLNGMVETLEAKADEAAAKADEAAAKADDALAAVRAGILAALEARGLAPPDALRARIASCDDPAVLQRWLIAALTATSLEALS
jgi:Uma2 family endonuclease